MANKYYAVKKGKTPGIYNSWEECKAQVDGVSSAEYKSFKSEQEARDYIGNSMEQKIVKKPVENVNTSCVEAYVDGSYNSETNEFSYGMIILQNGEELKFAEKYDDKELAAMHNVAGEIKGAEAAMRYAVENSLAGIIIYHDYEGIAKWCLGEWKANKEGTKAYKEYYESVKDKVSISFIKVTGHSNNKYNDIADELAKQALGIVGEKHAIEIPDEKGNLE
ncbi:ribonuclease H family protein [Lachnospiraceae bacterium 45-W7]